jgi:exodeoxyribonuclease VII large subunit
MSQPSLDFDEGLPTFTVGELAEAINGALRRGFFEGVWVRGEVQGLIERNGHAYFSLTDQGEDGKATVAVSLFANVRYKLRPLLQRHRLRLADGMKVRIHGFPDFYAPTGRLTLKMSGIDPRYTLGELALERDDLVRRLVADGIYDAQSRLAIPPLPLRVGLVTSVTSAAWHDVVDELSRSGFGFRVTACDVRVQGQGAPEMVAGALRALGRRPLDVIVLARGGGARAELATFDSEVIARAIAVCPVPVVTGLGHEVDRSVADEVGHLALKTPTACAAHLVTQVEAFREQMETTWTAIATRATSSVVAASRQLGLRAERTAQRTERSLGSAEAHIGRQRRRTVQEAQRQVRGAAAELERARGRARADARRHLALARSGLEADRRRLLQGSRPSVVHRQHQLDAVAARIRALDPAHAMARGWSITRDEDGHVVTSTAQLTAGQRIVTTVADGHVRSRVEDTSPA